MPDLSLRQIPFHSDLVSKPVRDNFTDTENAINNLQDQIDLLTTTPGGTEVTNARDYHTVLRDRLRSDSLGRGNILVSGGVVTEQGSPNMTVAISAGEAIVGGIACKWSGQNSGTITAPGSNTRLDYVVINSDNTISVVAGTAAASPAFPSVSSTQLIVAALVVKSTTTSLNDGVEIFVFKGDLPGEDQNFYIGSATTLSQGNYPFGNVIIDAAITLSCVQTGSFKALNKAFISIKCSGNYYATSNGSLALSSSNAITRYFKDGSNATGGSGNIGGGGGGASPVAAGGAGGFDGAAGGAGGTPIPNSSIGDPNYSSGKGGGGSLSDTTIFANDSDKIAILLIIIAYNISIYADITNNGGSPSDPGASGGAPGGNAGGTVCLIAKNDFIAGSITINVSGGAGADAMTDGGGGGGGAGGLIFIRSKTFTSSATLTVNGGAGGLLAGGGANGSNGSNGISSQKLWSDNDSIYNTQFPFNILGFSF